MRYSNKLIQLDRFIMESGLMLGQIVRNGACVGMLLLTVACAATPAKEASIEDNALTATEPVVDVQEEYKPLSPEMMYYILGAEIAGQRGEIGIAGELYYKASMLEESPVVAARAAQVAAYTKDQQQVSRAVDRWIEVDPTNAEVYMLQMPELIEQGNYEVARQDVDKAIALKPEKKEIYLTMFAEALSRFAKPDQAMLSFTQLETYQQSDVDALFAYSQLAMFFKHEDEALIAISQVLTIEPGHVDAIILKADILQHRGESEAALTLLSKAVKRDRNSEALRFSYAKLLAEEKQYDQAQELFEELLELQPENEQYLFALGLLALEEKDGQRAKDYFSQILKVGDRSQQAAYFMGLATELNNETEKALIWYASVTVQSPHYPTAQMRYVALLAKKGDLQPVEQHFETLRKNHPERAVPYYLFETSFLREQGKDQAAFDLYTEALKEFPTNIDLLYGRAMVSEPLNRLSVLEADLRAILRMEPNNAAALNALGYTLADRTDRYQEAMSLISRAVALSPEDPFYLDSLGWVHYRLGNMSEAEHYLQQAYKIQNDPEFAAHLGEVLWQSGKQSAAKKIWKQGLEKDAKNKLLLETMGRFNQ